MPSPVPPRDRHVYFVGAGLSSAFGLPNTPSLLTDAIGFARTAQGAWLEQEHFRSKLNHAFRFFYPDARNPGFQPQVVDFFSTLRSYLDVGAGLVGTGFADAPDLYRLLRRGIAHLLIERIRRIEESRLRSHPFLAEIVRPGTIIITSNWDVLIERYASLIGIPLRLTSSTRRFPMTEVSLLKLHGSLDWCQGSARNAGHANDDYATLKELQNATGSRRHQLPREPNDLVRVRTAPFSNTWQRVKSRSREPHMVTMVTGKADDLGPLREVWRDAYRALSRAARLDIIGYSMPADDVEIRTILRTGIQRGGLDPHLTVRNPAPDVHHRVRALLDANAQSDYRPVQGI